MKLWPRKMMKYSQSLGTVNLSINFFVLIPPLLTKLALYIVHCTCNRMFLSCPVSVESVGHVEHAEAVQI